MHRHLQFGMRENPASNRRHGSHTTVRSVRNENSIEEENLASLELSPSHNDPSPSVEGHSHASSPRAARGEERTSVSERSSLALTRMPPQKPAHGFEPLIGSPDAARLLGNIHVKTLQRYARHKRVPGYQIGGHWYFRVSELDSWVRSRLNSNCQSADRVDFTQEKIP